MFNFCQFFVPKHKIHVHKKSQIKTMFYCLLFYSQSLVNYFKKAIKTITEKYQ